MRAGFRGCGDHRDSDLGVLSARKEERIAVPARTLSSLRGRMVAVYSVTHFLVDLSCIFALFFLVGTSELHLCILLYNFCAFALQMPLGIVADRISRNFVFAAAGCLLIAAAYLLGQAPYVMVVVLGIGNAAFHLGGGIDVLNAYDKKAGPLGVFVSPGALGVYLGMLLAKSVVSPATPLLIGLPLLLLAAACMILLVRRAQGDAYPRNAEVSLAPAASPQLLLAATCLFLVVCLRSWAGLSLGFSWKAAPLLGLAVVCAVVLGKTLGGFAADRYGATRTAVISLGVAALLFACSSVPTVGVAAPTGIVALLLFNMTMPITLWALVRILPGAKGFCFGLLTFGLFLGFIPSYLRVAVFTDIGWLFGLASLASLALLWLALRKART
ncbi:MAG: hypothetical protein FWF91_04725 [Coriobacteriia bacterium]|nr:hypothetical protein [Coriobacteriia bacterium]